MILKIIAILLAVSNGLFMIVDGFYVIRKGKYMGPEKPGPWANLFYKLNINVFKLGPLFVLIGIGWMMWVYGLWKGGNWVYFYGLLISILTIWYIKVGTFISLITILLLLFFKQDLGL